VKRLAITGFAATHADRNERDHKSLVDAVTSGRITAEPGLQDTDRRRPDG
jgi:hypothetical protein